MKEVKSGIISPIHDIENLKNKSRYLDSKINIAIARNASQELKPSAFTRERAQTNIVSSNPFLSPRLSPTSNDMARN